MKLLDVNLLLYAVNEDSPHHAKARPWIEGVLSGTEAIAFDWTVILAFLRLATRPLIFASPIPVEEALALVEGWLSRPCVQVVQPTQQHLSVLADLLRAMGTAGNLTTDAHLAALAVEHGAELCSCDADFARFPGLRWTNPLA